MAIQEQYYCMTDNGDKPRYKHTYIESACVEANRLKKTTGCKKVEILKIVGVVEDVVVPVTKIETRTTLINEYKDSDDLPF
jgi:hypothetical protein